MSGSKKASSKRAGASSQNLSVLDFLYNDARRVGSFLSQFDPGHLQNLIRTQEAFEEDSEHSGRNWGIGAPGIVGGKGESAEDVTKGKRNTLQSVFDPYWTNARALLNYLEEHNLLQRDLDNAQLGQFVLATGYLAILDLGMMKEAWEKTSISKGVKQGIIDSWGPGTAVTAAQKLEAKKQRENAEQIFDFLKIMPHAVNATLLQSVGRPHMFWCALREEYMATPASEIVMSAGGFVQGDWTMMGVLNARPDNIALNNLGKPVNADLEPGIMDSMVGRICTMLAPATRIAIGRPANAHAITPLMIFRAAGGPAQQENPS